MRNGIYSASAFFVVINAGALRWVSAYTPINYPLVMPPLLLMNVTVAAVYFGAGIVFLERDQRIHAGLCVTPAPVPQLHWLRFIVP